MSLILGGNALNTNESVTKEEEKDGRGGWPPSPPCSSSVRPCDPPPHTASVDGIPLGVGQLSPCATTTEPAL